MKMAKAKRIPYRVLLKTYSNSNVLSLCSVKSGASTKENQCCSKSNDYCSKENSVVKKVGLVVKKVNPAVE